MISHKYFTTQFSENKSRYTFYFLSLWLLCSVYWIIKIFGNPSYEQIIFHLIYQTIKLNNFDRTMIESYGFYAIFLPILLTLIVIKIESIKFSFLENKNNSLKIIFGKFIPVYIAILGVFISYVNFGGDTGFSGYVGAADFNTYNPTFSNRIIERDPNYFANNYINPRDVKLDVQDKKNLILIYAESFEKSYSNSKIFKTDLTEDLTSLNGISFDAFNQTPGTGWTIAGIVSSQCAVPLKVVFMRDGNGQGDGKSFMPNAICLGDTLKNFGYKNVFLNGPSLNFAGVDLFLKSHGYTEIYGKEDWLATGRYLEKDFNYWGLQDDDLFQEAKSKLDQLVNEKQSFNLTLLTVNTHGPDGFLSKSCKKNGGTSFEDIIKCTSKEIANFILYVKSKGYDKNTNIVVLGDHLSIPNPVINKLKSDSKRSIYNLFISKSSFEKTRENIIHFDFAPTILDLSGINVVGARYGLGYSAIGSSTIEPPITRLDDMHRDLLNISTKYMDLWKTD